MKLLKISIALIIFVFIITSVQSQSSKKNIIHKKDKVLVDGTVPSVTTATVSSASITTAVCGGEVIHGGFPPPAMVPHGGSELNNYGDNPASIEYPVIARGVCWNTGGTPTIANSTTSDGSGLGEFTSNLTGLSPATTYYVRAYATNDQNITGYGSQVSFTTLDFAAITTASVTNILITTATCGGTISDDYGNPITARGVCWRTTANPTIANSKTINGSGTGSFSSNLTSLSPSVLYYVRAYATNTEGTAYGNNVTFTTLPTLPEWGLYSLIAFSMVIGGWWVIKKMI